MYWFCLLSKYSLLSPLPSFHSETKDGQVQAVKNNPAVPTEVLAEIFEWKQSGVDDNDIIQRLRLKTVPTGYTPCPWTGKCISLCV